MTDFSPPEVAIPADVPDLTGKPRGQDRVYFAAPPAEIGPLYRVESSLKVGKRPLAPGMRLLILGLALLPGAALALLALPDVIKGEGDFGVLMLIAGAVLMLLGFLPAWYYTRFRVYCAYVGQLGAVRYTVRGKIENQPRVEAIQFERAAELRTAQTRHYYHGVYTGTTYRFNWTDAQGRRVLMLKGTHRGKDGTPKAGDPFNFANATEIAWSMFLLNRADAELAQHGALTFHLDAKKSVIVGPGFIEFHFGGRTDRCEAADIKSISLNAGQFAIHHRDAKWYSSKGKFSFPYGNMANARLFLLVLDRFLPPSTWAPKT
jgi:hypothetical protein